MKVSRVVCTVFVALIVAALVAGCTEDDKKSAGKVENPADIDMDHFWYRVSMDSPEQGTMSMEYMVDKPRIKVDLEISKGDQEGAIRFLSDGKHVYLLDDESKTALRYEYSEEIVQSLIPEALDFTPSFEKFKEQSGMEPDKAGRAKLEGIEVQKYEFNAPSSPERTVLYVSSQDIIRRIEVFRKEAGKLFSLNVEKLETSPEFAEGTFQPPEEYKVKTTDLPALP